MTTIAQRRSPLPVSGCTVRVGTGSHGRPALEVYAGDGTLLDVAVADALGSALLRGGIRGGPGSSSWSLAWGHVWDGGPEPVVMFGSRRGVRLGATALIAGSFWVSEAPGRGRSVTVEAGVATATGRLYRIPGRRCA